MSITLRAKRILTGALAGAMVLGLLPAGVASAATTACQGAASGTFTDSNPTHQANIDCVAAYGVVTGFANGTFGGSQNITRGQMATFIARFAATTLNVDITDIEIAEHTFTDVAGNVHADNIARIFGLNVTAGRTATTFAPNDTITRAEAATMLANAHVALGVDLSGVTPSTAFTDLGTSVHADNINLLAGAGVISGKTATTFAPSASILRAEAATLLVRSITVLRSQNIWAAPALPGAISAGLVVTNVDDKAATPNKFEYADPAQAKAVEVDFTTGKTFTIDGVSATKSAFIAALTVGDEVTISGNVINLTNRAESFYTSGMLGVLNVGGDLTIIEPVTGATLRTLTVPAHVAWTLDGQAVIPATITQAFNVGDTVAISGGDGSEPAKVMTIAVTNQTVTGTIAARTVATNDLTGVTVKTPAGATLTVGDINKSATVSVDGTANVTLANVAVGDQISYAKNVGTAGTGNVITVSITSVAPALVTGQLTAVADNGASNVDFTIIPSGASAVTSINVAISTFTLNGQVASRADIVDGFILGWTASYRPADTRTSTTSRLDVTTGTLSGALSAADIDTMAKTVVVFAAGSTTVKLPAVNYTTQDFKATGDIKYRSNGADVSLAAFETELAKVKSGEKTGSLAVSFSGNDVIYAITTAANTAEVTFTVEAATANATSITLTFSQPIVSYTFPASGITLSGAAVGAQTVDNVTVMTVNGTNSVVLTLSAALTATAGQELTVTISEAGAAKFVDINGNGVKAGSASEDVV